MALGSVARAKILNALETLLVGSAGGLLFVWANLPGGLISGSMIAVGAAALAGRPLAVPPIITPGRAGAAWDFAWLAGLATVDPAYRRLSLDHRLVGVGDVLLDFRQQHLSAARS